MPTSAWDGRKWVADRIERTTASTIIDVGPGEGTHSVLARHLRWDAHWTGVEIHEPYVERFLLEQKYDLVRVADIREIDPYEGGADYVILFGDVLEHMTKDDAVRLLETYRQFAQEIYVSVPIVFAPQDECFGNEHEAHLYHWHYNEMLDLMLGWPGEVEAFQGVQVGRFWWRRETGALV